MNTGAPTTTALTHLFTSADSTGNATISLTQTAGGAAAGSVTIVANPGGGGTETTFAVDGSFLASETLDPVKAIVDIKKSATEDCTYSNGRTTSPPMYVVGATWSNSGTLTCTTAPSSAGGTPTVSSGPYSGSGSVLTQENVTVNGTSYPAYKYQYSETYQRQAATTVQGVTVPVYTEIFTTTCDFIPTLKLDGPCETKYTYAGDVPSSYLADDVTQLVSATIH
jgi:hypothetical protein